MNLLAIETSTTRASVALCMHEQLFVLEETSTNQHARVLLSMIEQLFSLAHTDFKALDGIVFGEGPGSFTGVRIACSVAKGLAYAHDLPLFPVSGLHAIGFQMRALNKPVLAILDARMHQVYWAFQPGVGVAATVSSPENVFIPESMLSPELLLAGVGFKPYVSAFPRRIQDVIVGQHDVFPDAHVMIEIVRHEKIQPVTAQNALPMYVREQVTGGKSG